MDVEICDVLLPHASMTMGNTVAAGKAGCRNIAGGLPMEVVVITGQLNFECCGFSLCGLSEGYPDHQDLRVPSL